ncbi:MAG TPA: NAD(P)H-binding protein [Myxococcota bacterium]
MTEPRALFVTGATGFVGRRVLACAAERFGRVIALARSEPADLPAGVELLHGDLLGPAPRAWERALAGCDAVLHLAATTGKAAPAEYERGIVDATAALAAAAQRAGVRHFVYVSSIAVRFPDRAHYPYAHAKQRAEQRVRESGVRATIVRPTIVAGPGSPVMQGFATLALAPVTPVFGDGQRRVAPIHVDDLAALLVEIAAGEPSAEPIELGGPETFTLDALLSGLRVARGGGPPRLAHLPLAPIRALLAALEPALRPILPLTAGQLATFANDGVPVPSAFRAQRTAALRGVLSADAVAPPAPPRAAAETLRAECGVFARHLLGIAPSPALVQRYVRQQRALGLDAPAGFDALLVAFARRGGLALALADSYAGWLARRSVLRTKLVGVLALLETAPESFAAVDAPDARLAWPRLVLRGVAELATALVAIVLLAPLHVLLGRR